jgi:LysM repeat protein
MYEWGQGTIAGSIDQTHMDYINAGAGEGVVMALQPLLNLQYYGIRPQSFFSLTEYKNGASNGLTNKLWGNVVDMGGATNNVRPEFLGVSLVNQSIIGSMYSCPITNNPTYNFAGSPNGISALPALNNVPYLYAFCFENGTKRSMVLINTDLSGSHTVNFTGTNPPAGSVTQRQYAPAALDDMNEAPTGTATNQTQATVAIDTSSLSSPSSISLPPFSVTALDYTASGLTAAAAPTFSVAAGSYTTAQSVTISDATAGTTIYYTTNGTTPTTSSTQYTGAITVSATETLEAIAVETGCTNSSVTTAAYTISAGLPAPTFSVAAGSYTTAQTMTISDATAGATIYYTTNGTTPTTSSTQYTGAISVSATETLEAIAVETGYTNSPVATAVYTIAPVLPAPTFSVAAGSYTTAQTVTISDATAGATIYYTTNGATPTTSSTKYTGAITVSATETLEAIAVETGYTNSPVTTAVYTIAAGLSAPVFSPAPTTYTSPQSVTISDATAGATIYYTTNGTTPTTSSTQYMGAIWQTSTQTLKAIAVETGYTNSSVTTAAYTIAPVLPAPTFSPIGGGASWATFTTPQSVTISDTQAGTTFYYTTNGTTPTTSSTLYTGPITVSQTETIEAIAVESGYTNSPMSSMLYTIAPMLPAPTLSLAAGSYTTSQSVTISDSTAGAAIYYTTNGTTPTSSSTKYTGAISVSATETLEAIAVESGYCNSPAATATYTIAAALPAPTFSLAAGTYTTSQTVTISDTTAGTTIHYTTNGTTPTSSSTVYSGPVTVSATETLEAIAVETGYTNSSVATAAYTIAPVLPAPAFSLAAGTYATSQTVTISDTTAGTTIHYTTNGTTPTSSSTVYSGPVTVSATETLEAIAVETGYTNSSVATAAYTIAPVLPSPAFSLAAGTYTTSQTVTISDATAGTTIYYTTNGATPTTSSTVYSGPITVSATETLEAIAVETGYTNSPVGTAAYTIAPVLPTPTFSLTAGTYTTSQTVTITDATAGTTIHYTTNGTTPTSSSTVYSGPVTVSATETLEAIAIETGYTNSSVATAAYTIAPVLPSPTFSLAAGTYTTSQTVTISDATAGTTIYYTTNGTTPTTSSTQYTGAITVSASETLEAIAAETGYTNSPATATAYTIAPVLPAPTFSLAAGSYSAAQTVTISDATAGSTIYYTTNGTTPTTSSTLYSGPITVSATETLEAIAVETGYTSSSAATVAYTIVIADPTYINYPSSGFTATSLSLNNGPTVTGGVLQLADGGTGESRSAWFNKAVPVSTFTTDFTFQILNGAADGFTFTIENDPKGIWALGDGGSGLGYQSIQNSVAVKFDIYSDAGEGTDSIGVYTDGAAPTMPATDLSSSGVILSSGDLIHAHLVYNGTTLTVTLTDTKTGATVTNQYTVNIPSVVGSTTAYAGFTGSTGGFTSVQQITSWTYSAQ